MRSTLVLTIAHWVAIGVVVLVLFLMAYILCLRGLLLLKERRYQNLSATWRPILLNTEESSPAHLPPISPVDRPSFLILWNMLREEKDSDAKTSNWMNQVAVATRTDRYAARLLAKRGIRGKLLAIVTLGQLRDKSQWEILCRMALSDHSLLSLAVTQAIARIDPAVAVSIIVPLAVRRANWPAAKVASILKEIGPDLVSKPLTEEILRASTEELQRLIPFLETCHSVAALSTVHQILSRAHDDKVIGPCLYVIGKTGNKGDLKIVRQYLAHPRWHVRAHAATCLGKIGTNEDEGRLSGLLTDAEWWVRYRAAQAILNLPSSSIERANNLRGALKDRYAKDILAQAIAEKQAM